MTDLINKIASSLPAFFNPSVKSKDVADDILAIIKANVPELVWWVSDTGDLCADTTMGRYQIQKSTTRFCCMYAMGRNSSTKGDDAPTWHKKEEAAKAAANAHHAEAMTDWMDQ